MARIKEGLGERSTKLHKRPLSLPPRRAREDVGRDHRGWAVGSPQFVDGRTPSWSEAFGKAGIG